MDSDDPAVEIEREVLRTSVVLLDLDSGALERIDDRAASPTQPAPPEEDAA